MIASKIPKMKRYVTGKKYLVKGMEAVSFSNGNECQMSVLKVRANAKAIRA
jgi:hypothetical protein